VQYEEKKRRFRATEEEVERGSGGGNVHAEALTVAPKYIQVVISWTFEWTLLANRCFIYVAQNRNSTI
jgi:hypothetical protein